MLPYIVAPLAVSLASAIAVYTAAALAEVLHTRFGAP